MTSALTFGSGDVADRRARGRLAAGAVAALFLVATASLGASVPPRRLPPVGTTSSTVDAPRWRTVWEDRFDGPTVDRRRWDVEHSTFGDGNHELQCYTPGNVRTGPGGLVLEARRVAATCPSGSTRAFSSGMLRSRAAWAYGAFEARVRVPRGAGFLPAVWLLPQRYAYGRDGRSGELDVMEVVTDDPSEVRVTAHWSHAGACGWGCRRYGRAAVVPGADASTAFHDYRLEWEPGRLTWFVDGDPVYELGEGAQRWASGAERPVPGSATYPAPFDAQNPMYLLVNLAVGGDTPGAPTAATPFPARMEVAWVRVQQRA